MSEHFLATRTYPPFRRRSINLRRPTQTNGITLNSISEHLDLKAKEVKKTIPAPVVEEKKQSIEEQPTVLVINSSHEMAKEITTQLTRRLPNCSIMYAPTIEIARWLIKRRKIDLVVSSDLLPDGNISRLQKELEAAEYPPNLVVVGSNMDARNTAMLTSSSYEFAVIRRFRGEEKPAPKPVQIPLEHQIKKLGADIRNDLNNPLQEIVAMVFVAQAGTELNATTQEALMAIDSAAKNMAKVVTKLEEKIRGAVI